MKWGEEDHLPLRLLPLLILSGPSFCSEAEAPLSGPLCIPQAAL